MKTSVTSRLQLSCPRYLVWGRYAGYTQGSSEYSVKSLTEREAAKLLSSAGVRRLYTPCPDTKPGLNNAGDNKQQTRAWGND